MVKHIVFWKLKDQAEGKTKAENAQLIKEKLEALDGQIDGLISIEVGINFVEGNFDIALYSELATKETLDVYQNHPKHQALLPFIRSVIEDRKAVDYEI